MHTSTSTDSEIACFLAKRDKRAISLLYANYSPVIYGIIRKMIPHDEMADDIMQDVFVKIWENADKYDARKGRLFTWLAQITRNTTIDWLRSASYARKMKTCNLETTGDIPVAPFSIQDSGLKKMRKNTRLGLEQKIPRN